MEISKKTIKSNMLWNIIGSSFFCGCQWIMSILIVHISGYDEAGYLSLGLSLTNTFINIGYYSIRSFQVSDFENKYYSSTYVTHRIITSTIAYALYFIFVLVNGYSPYVTLFLLAFMFYRLIEAFVDVFHGIDQKAWRLDIVGKSNLFRGILMIIAFIVVEAVTKNLVITSITMFLSGVIVVMFYDIPKAKKIEHLQLDWNKSRLWSLTQKCFPLLIYSLCINSIMPFPRYFLELNEGSTVLGYYASVATPAAMIQLLAAFIFNPFIRLFAEYIQGNKKAEFVKLMIKIIGIIIALASGILVVSVYAGEWGLRLLFNDEIVPYAYLLISTVVCCGMLALSWFLGTLLIVIRDFKFLSWGAISGLLISIVSSFILTREIGIDGVNYALLIAFSIVLIIYFSRIFNYIKKWK